MSDLDGELDDSLVIVLEGLRDRLRRDADRETREAMLMQVYALAGYGPKEIEQRLGISAEDRRLIVGRLKRALRGLTEA